MADHHPPHVYLDHTWYMITASTLNQAAVRSGMRTKSLLRSELQKLLLKFNTKLRAWVILDNHYHLLLKTDQGGDLGSFFARLHGSTSRQINLWHESPGRQVWHNYWDTCIRDEAGLWKRFNYIHLNPVKHGYVQRMEDWAFSSYRFYLRTKGRDWLADCEARYPVVDWLAGDGFGTARPRPP
jgi:putative transposase